ncbi:GNAT family N-acetyltransferase [Ensifer adhaerens]|uniref:GNAT family N-acetyltransferase n=1 Tax=Ensifer adhaerens TaxID=106592 RepID=UPI0023A9BC8E|nr:GNAT family N-acetyltransferase [Ensifer adhaerens]WDZ77545.1 GNAT family N-acetyltransferase [Ensifer adhaerens]
MHIKHLEQGDVEIFRSIRLEALNREPQAFASTAADWERLSTEEWRERLTTNAVFVALDEDRPLGIMGLMRERASRLAHRATIIMVYVRDEARGSGAAHHLLTHLTDHAHASGVRLLELVVRADNPTAIRFYAREGFHEIGRVPGGMLDGDVEVDEILMARHIDGRTPSALQGAPR